MGSWEGRGNQYIQLVKVLYCKLPTNGKQIPAFPLEARPGTEPQSQRWEVRVLPDCQWKPNSGFTSFYLVSDYCIHRIASGGYYGFDFVTPTLPPPQCVERFHRYRSNKNNIIASLLKFAGYIHSHKILPGIIFGLILKNKMAATGVSLQS